MNMASRMESHGTPDEIQITRSTRELLGDHFVTERIGLVNVKGKGAIEDVAAGRPACMPTGVAVRSQSRRNVKTAARVIRRARRGDRSARTPPGP